ncbi:hypothetical protein COO91_05769 [Nostoc flagelliforme CCNUN1]|uniref:Uncharacterized protein n=1 Tax=Nostoc flagelliforme CCNUN1 TaxID=2038116 RepID=A0A2K8SWC7_9NOSO|nr:hypothetical protein COO91_05769 [Nostoc flagelliforme CCNUN1]
MNPSLNWVNESLNWMNPSQFSIISKQIDILLIKGLPP